MPAYFLRTKLHISASDAGLLAHLLALAEKYSMSKVPLTIKNCILINKTN